jgi:hypothetical protein
MRAGETVPVAATRETLDFIRNARKCIARSSGVSGNGFVLGPSVKGDQVVLAAALTMKPGEYAVRLTAVNKTGEERAMTLHVTLDPRQTAPVPVTMPPVVLLNGWQAQIVSTQALIAQGWVVQGDFALIPPALLADVQSELVLDDKYDSLENAVDDSHPGAR